MVKNGFLYRSACLVLALAFVLTMTPFGLARAQDPEPAMPVMLDPTLGVRSVLDGLMTPIGIAFPTEDSMFVIEKNTGIVHYVTGGSPTTALDLAVNFASERGLLGITLDPDFENNHYVYLYWSCSAPAPSGSGYYPSEVVCDGEPASGADTDDVLAVPLLGNRVDRFVWDGSALTWDRNLVTLRSFQNDGAPLPRGQGDEDQPPRGNHDGGVITFGNDGKLYIIIGDVGRRGALQNLPFGPIPYNGDNGEDVVVPPDSDMTAEQLREMVQQGGVLFSNEGRFANLRFQPDDQFGGPFPDDAHYTGVILRLNNDGSIPSDNPFYNVGSVVGGEVGENLQKTFAYGIRNSFGMAVDPKTGGLWITENGEDAYDEINFVRPGFNSGWIQIQGPLADVRDYKEIETTSLNNEDFPNLQQFRWSPESIADSPGEAFSRLFRLPGSRFADPAFSWEFVTAPAALGFVDGEALGSAYDGDMFMGMSIPFPLGGALFRFDLTASRTKVAERGEREAENGTFYSLKGSEKYLIGSNFGVVTDIETGPNGNLYVVSLDQGVVYEVFKEADAAAVELHAELNGANEVPGPGDPDGTGVSHVFIDPEAGEVCFSIVVQNITLPAAAAHIHSAPKGVAGPVVVPFVAPDEMGNAAGCVTGQDPALLQAIVDKPADYYVNVHTSDFPGGAVRGQLSKTR